MGSDRARGNREAKKPKKETPKVIAAAPSTKGQVAASTKPGAKR
ncbi:hypothetical protein [Methylobacterium currus]|nr:hypothetical protein [Methylobacterium currus]